MSRFDYTFEETENLENLKRMILANFQSRGYRQIHLSAFESVETFVEQKGENVRQKIFTLNGETDAELCLRPELTVPACKFYLNSLANSMDRCRICYEGLVWRMNPVESGFYNEFTQTGIELIGNFSEMGADTEILELAVDTLVRCGVSISNIVVNDVRILKHVFSELGIGHKRQSQIEQALIRGEGIDELGVGQSSSRDNSDLFDHVLDSVGPEKLSEFLVEILSLQGYSQGMSGRTPQDVAERLIRKKTGEANELTQQQRDVLSELLQISGDVQVVAQRLSKFATAHHFEQTEQFGELVDLLVNKTKLLTAALPEEVGPEIRWDLNFQRSFKYYSGLIFDINSANGAVCGGGRYDNLLTQIGAKQDLKAAGFAIGIDRLLNERTSTSGAGQLPRALVALLHRQEHDGNSQSESRVRYDLYQRCFQIANQVRQSSWTAETDFSGAGHDEILNDATKASVELILWIGLDELKSGSVTIQRLAENTEETIPGSELSAYLSQWRQPTGGA